MKIALCTIAREEDEYLPEWIEYYRKLGVSDFYIYENGFDWIYSGRYCNDEDIHLIPYDRHICQESILTRFSKKYWEFYDFAAFFDVDEFLVIKNGKTNLCDFLADYEDYSGVAINWNMMGNSNIEFNDDYSVVKRFTKCRNNLSEYVKLILNFRKIKGFARFYNAHTVDIQNSIVNVCKTNLNQQMINVENLEESKSIAYLNHYFTKTKEEYCRKVKRGIGYFYPEKEAIHRMNLFDTYSSNEYNEVEDMSALNFIKTGKFI